MDTVCYYARRGVAIAFGLTLTGYSAWLSWAHFGTALGPLVAFAAAVLLVLAEHAWRHSKRRALLLGFLGVAAAVISGTVVADRVTATDQARVQSTRDANLPRVAALKALDDAKAELKDASDAAKDECASGRRKRCWSLEEREAAARQRVEDARAKLVGLGAQADEDPAAALFGAWAATYRLALPLALPMWLEIAAPVLLAYGFAPAPRKGPEPPLQRKPEHRPERKASPAPERLRKRKGSGTSYGTRKYWLARLDRSRPDLARLVRAGEMSANMAAIKAGFRKSPVKLVSATR